MLTSPHRRRFIPSLDRLQSRLVPSGPDVVITPMDPILLGGENPPEVVITPMDPCLLGGGGDDSLPSDSLSMSLPYLDSALAMGDGLLAP